MANLYCFTSVVGSFQIQRTEAQLKLACESPHWEMRNLGYYPVYLFSRATNKVSQTGCPPPHTPPKWETHWFLQLKSQSPGKAGFRVSKHALGAQCCLVSRMCGSQRTIRSRGHRQLRQNHTGKAAFSPLAIEEEPRMVSGFSQTMCLCLDHHRGQGMTAVSWTTSGSRSHT